MYNSSFVKSLMAMLVSATMAFPSSLWADKLESQRAAKAAEQQRMATDGIPFLLEPLKLKNGQTVYLTMAAVPMAVESTVVTTLAKNNPERSVLVINGPDDPAFKAAAATGYLPWMNTFVADRIDQAPLTYTNQLAPTIKAGLLNRIKSISAFASEKRFALMTAIVVGGMMGNFTLYTSSSVSAGLKVFAVAFLWAAFQNVMKDKWEWALEHGGIVTKNIVLGAAATIGRALKFSKTDVKKETAQSLEAFGSFLVPLAANLAMVSFVFSVAGSYDNFWVTLLAAFTVSYDILDKKLKSFVDRGWMSAAIMAGWIGLRSLAGPIFDVLSFMHVPNVELGLGLLTLTGLLWAAIGTDFDAKVGNKIWETGFRLTDKVSRTSRKISQVKRNIKAKCEDLLGKGKVLLQMAQGTDAEEAE